MLEVLARNWPLKLLALILAYAIWFSVIDEERVIEDISIPLELSLTADQILRSEVPAAISLRLEGTETAIRRINPRGIVARIDLTGRASGEQEIRLDTEHLVGLKREYAVRFMTPDRLNVTLSQKVRRRVGVEPTLLGRPSEGFKLYSAETQPTRVEIEGPAEEIEAIDVVRSTPVQLEGRRASFTTRATLAPESPYVSVLGDAGLRVRLLIAPLPVERRFTDVPVVLDPPREGWRAVPATVGVTLTAPPRVLDALAQGGLRAVADGSALDSEAETQQVSITVAFPETTELDRPLIQIKSLSRDRVALRRQDG